jgi:mannose/fructose/N-acetylgalactosamine-specific phosphotransferase system component IIB
MSLALARVDDRLVHGQVVLAWAGTLKASRLLVADDSAAAAAWERQLLTASAGDLEVDVFPVAETGARLLAERARSGAAILLFRSPSAALAAVEAGAALEELNLGGLHHAPGREPVLDYLYLNQNDRQALRRLEEHGVRLSARDLPSSRPLPAAEWLEPGSVT